MNLPRTMLVLWTLVAFGCEDQDRQCTLVLQSNPYGITRDEAGNAVSPTRVVRRDHGAEHECRVHARGYWCDEQNGGAVEIEVYVADKSWLQRAKIATDGCHERDTQLDFVLKGLPSCEPAIAVEGSLPYADGDSEVTLERKGTGPERSSFRSPCVVEGDRYRCPALALYDTGDFDLRRNGDVEVTLRIEASDCRVETQRFDFE